MGIESDLYDYFDSLCSSDSSKPGNEMFFSIEKSDLLTCLPLAVLSSLSSLISASILLTEGMSKFSPYVTLLLLTDLIYFTLEIPAGPVWSFDCSLFAISLNSERSESGWLYCEPLF